MADDQGKAPERRRGAELRRYAAPALISGLLVWFALANDQRVEVDFLLTTRDARLIWVIVVSVGLGVLLGALAARRGRRR